MSSKARILIADDDPNVVCILKVTLEAEGYQVSTARDGGEALQMAREVRPDLAILDIMMPGLDGYKVCHYLRNDPVTAGMQVLMLTGKSGPRDQIKAFDNGADDYLTKSDSLDEIVSRVEALLWAEAL